MKRFHGLIERIVAWFCRVFHLSLSEEGQRNLTQFVEFALVGVTNSVISYGVNVGVLALLKPLNLSWDYIPANVAAFVLSVLWSYFWNDRFVFPEDEEGKRSAGKTLLKTYLAYGFTGIILTNILSWLWVDVLGVSKYISPLINIVICMPVNFLINKYWAFRGEGKSGASGR